MPRVVHAQSHLRPTATDELDHRVQHLPERLKRLFVRRKVRLALLPRAQLLLPQLAHQLRRPVGDTIRRDQDERDAQSDCRLLAGQAVQAAPLADDARLGRACGKRVEAPRARDDAQRKGQEGFVAGWLKKQQQTFQSHEEFLRNPAGNRPRAMIQAAEELKEDVRTAQAKVRFTQLARMGLGVLPGR